jgi:hypothetical protein
MLSFRLINPVASGEEYHWNTEIQSVLNQTNAACNVSIFWDQRHWTRSQPQYLNNEITRCSFVIGLQACWKEEPVWGGCLGISDSSRGICGPINWRLRVIIHNK